MAVRIGLAFNLKPEAPANPAGADPSSPSSPDEPALRSLREDLSQPDLYAEWDEPATIDAVERALSTVGQVYRLEADETFPARLALIRPDFVFNIAEGLYGPNREGHVPAGPDPLEPGRQRHPAEHGSARRGGRCARIGRRRRGHGLLRGQGKRLLPGRHGHGGALRPVVCLAHDLLRDGSTATARFGRSRSTASPRC